MSDHAFLPPSSASRWLACTKSARLEETFEKKANTSFADEGTLAHELAVPIIQSKLFPDCKKEYEWKLAIIEKSEYYNATMHEYVDEYADFVIEHFNEARVHTPDAELYLERRLNLSRFIPECYGTGDSGIVADTLLTVIDLKYGKGVYVDANENKQMMVYALGWLDEFKHLYNIKKVKMIIYQPRMYNISEFEMFVDDLYTWAEKELIPKANLAYEGKGTFVAGEHCKFCRAKVACKAFADFNLQITASDFADPVLLTDEEIVDIITRADTFKNWIEAVEKWALDEALVNKKWPGMKLVEGKSNRIFPEPGVVADHLLKTYSKDQIFNTKLKGIGDLEKLMGKKLFLKELNSYLVKPKGAPALVSAQDPRPEYSGTDSAIKDFSDDK